jgi:hypothetical protein
VFGAVHSSEHLAGLILQFDLFLENNYGLLFFLFFLFQAAMSSLAMFCSSLLAKTQTAVYLGFAVFILGWVMQTASRCLLVDGFARTQAYAVHSRCESSGSTLSAVTGRSHHKHTRVVSLRLFFLSLAHARRARNKCCAVLLV